MPRAKKLSVSELLRLACYHAELSVRELVECERQSDPDIAADDEAFVKQLHEYRLKRWGKTPLERIIDDATEISVHEVMRRHVAESA